MGSARGLADSVGGTPGPCGAIPALHGSSVDPDPSPTTDGPSSTDTTTAGGTAEGEAPVAVSADVRETDGQIVIDASWSSASDAKLPVLYQLLAADGSPLSKISTLAGGTASVIITDTETGPLSADETYCVAVGFINTSAKARAPAACTDGSTLDVTR